MSVICLYCETFLHIPISEATLQFNQKGGGEMEMSFKKKKKKISDFIFFMNLFIYWEYIMFENRSLSKSVTFPRFFAFNTEQSWRVQNIREHLVSVYFSLIFI